MLIPLRKSRKDRSGNGLFKDYYLYSSIRTGCVFESGRVDIRRPLLRRRKLELSEPKTKHYRSDRKETAVVQSLIEGGVTLIENPTDQIAVYSSEIACAVKEIQEVFDCSTLEAIEIVRIGAYNIRTEVIKHYEFPTKFEVSQYEP